MARACLLILAACGRVGFEVEPDIGRCSPAAEEVCNGFDDDCDLAVDEGCACEEQILDFPLGWAAYRPAIAWSGSGYGVVWTEADEWGTGSAQFAYIDGAGASPPVSLPGQAVADDIVWTGDRFLVVTREYTMANGTYTIKTMGVHPDGTLAGEPNPIGSPGRDPRLVSLGDGHAIVYSTEHQQLRFAAIDRSGALVRSSAITGLDAFYSLRVASAGTQFAVLWAANNSGGAALSLQAFDVEGTAVGARFVVAADTFQNGHAIASAKDAYGIMWTEPMGMNRNLFFARADAGGLLGPTVPLITDAGILASQADLAWTGKHFIGVWPYQVPVTFEHRTMLTYLDTSGARLVPDRYLATEHHTIAHPRLAIADGRIGLVWPVSLIDDLRSYIRFAQLCD